MGNYKYALLAPFALAVAAGKDDSDQWYLHMLGIAAVRYALAQVFMTASRIHAISGKNRIQKRGISFEQMDREENWDDFIILHALVMTLVHWVVPGFANFPLNDGEGLWVCLALHAGPTELAYYWFHRALHHHSLFQKYHSHHHKSFVTEPVSGSCHPFLEHVGYTATFAIPMLGTWAVGKFGGGGGASVAMFYCYTAGFDVLNMVGHCNWEFVPVKLYRLVPFLKYLVYTPSYHSLHHSRVHTNFCLFMPVYDWLFGTLERDWHRKDDDDEANGGEANSESKLRSLFKSKLPGWTSDRVQAEARSRPVAEPPQCVFLAHGTDLLSALHLPMLFRGFAKHPYQGPHWLFYPLYPLVGLAAAVLWLVGQVFVSHVERVGGKPVQTWVVPRFGFQYFLGKKEEDRINAHIVSAILAANAQGVSVFGLGALNKAEHLNAGGSALLPTLLAKANAEANAGSANSLPASSTSEVAEVAEDGLKTRVVHGNTLTAACLLKELDPALFNGEGAVFLTGATSKLGRAAALYLCRRGVQVRMLTSSVERFNAIAAEVENDPEVRACLSRVEDHSSGSECATWVVCKQCSKQDQSYAPIGTHFHQVVVPPIDRHRDDCTYGELAAMKLPPSATDTKACELFMDRRCVFACHAGALTHMLSGWSHHEVGAIDVGAIDTVWTAALGLGFKPVTKGWPLQAAQAVESAAAEAEAAARDSKAAAAAKPLSLPSSSALSEEEADETTGKAAARVQGGQEGKVEVELASVPSLALSSFTVLAGAASLTVLDDMSAQAGGGEQVTNGLRQRLVNGLRGPSPTSVAASSSPLSSSLPTQSGLEKKRKASEKESAFTTRDSGKAAKLFGV